MSGLSLRDRFFTPPVARAVTSPSGILLVGVGASLGILVGGGVIGALALGALAWSARVGAAIPRPKATEQIDPFAIAEPWRTYVAEAVGAKDRFRKAVDSSRSGPLHDRLRDIQDRVDTGVREVWGIARRGNDLMDALGRIDPDSIRAEVALCREKALASGSATDQRTLESLGAQLAIGERLEAVVGDTDSQLRLLNARLDEAVVRTIELSVQADDVADLGGLGNEVDQMVDEMEALRRAIDETGGGPAPSTTP